MIVSPYFGAASLIRGGRSVWVEANRLLNRHISFPFLGGIALFWLKAYGLGYDYSWIVQGVSIVIVYVVFVVFSTVTVVMASRREEESSSAAHSPTT